MSSPFFETHAVKQKVPRFALGIIFMVSAHLNEEPELVLFPTTLDSAPWICFNVKDRQFGIWTETMKLYEADKHGAMGEDILDPFTLEVE